MKVKSFVFPYKGIENKIKTKSYMHYNRRKIEVDAQWDTGASGSCVSHDVVKKLGLIPVAKIPAMTPSGKCIYDAYLVDVELPNGIFLNDVLVCDSEIGAQGIGMLVGMDIISKGDIAISNYNGRTIFSFRFPSCGDINLVKKA